MAELIEEIRQKINGDQFEFSKHAVDQSILRGIRVQEVIEAISLLDKLSKTILMTNMGLVV
jgi:RNA processing factor Prp31